MPGPQQRLLTEQIHKWMHLQISDYNGQDKMYFFENGSTLALALEKKSRKKSYQEQNIIIIEVIQLNV